MNTAKILMSLGLGLMMHSAFAAEFGAQRISTSPDQIAFCTENQGYVQGETCYIGTPETCNQSNTTFCMDAAPEFGILMNLCSCQ